ncbi:hypothetical protein BN8_03929 [Fibrisoma limi BUZ 3]|uniref:Lipoprotein n=1 Tax=Fibrisoma limi BUZ 3 TaxID=1185876 RepID=I2GLF3_9BACT|nr:hypothetical protein [Fibrisoma limi]CCH54729.1 hypothetical protein BN8_03929 [Fibrisoma limi BUZ 3]
MKTILLALLSVAVLTTSCKKGTDVIPGGHVDTKAVGKWMYGSFAMGDFWSYDGAYQGKPFELAVVFDFKENGTYEKYFVASTRDYIGCRTESFSYEKGSVDFNETDGSFTTPPAEGKYRGFYSCIPSKNINRKMERSELKSQTYYYELKTGSNRQPNLVVRFNPGDVNTSTFLPTSW